MWSQKMLARHCMSSAFFQTVSHFRIEQHGVYHEHDHLIKGRNMVYCRNNIHPKCWQSTQSWAFKRYLSTNLILLLQLANANMYETCHTIYLHEEPFLLLSKCWQSIQSWAFKRYLSTNRNCCWDLPVHICMKLVIPLIFMRSHFSFHRKYFQRRNKRQGKNNACT